MKYVVIFFAFALISILFFKKCGNDVVIQKPVETIVHDTVLVKNDTIFYSVPALTQHDTVPAKEIEPVYIPDTNKTLLFRQYVQVTKEYLARNIYSDSIPVDSIGYLVVKDTVSKNTITGRSIKYNFNYPKITTTITREIPIVPKNQVYLGGGINSSIVRPAPQIEAGLIFKTKKDNMFQAKIGYDFKGNITYGISRYWKIKF